MNDHLSNDRPGALRWRSAETHDPLCPLAGTVYFGSCRCDLIATVRADERAHLVTEWSSCRDGGKPMSSTSWTGLTYEDDSDQGIELSVCDFGTVHLHMERDPELDEDRDRCRSACPRRWRSRWRWRFCDVPWGWGTRNWLP